MMSTARAGGLVERAVAEAIDAVAIPSVRERVISLALRWARRSDIPERGPDVGHFVRDALYRAVESALGPEAAASVRDELDPVVEMVADNEVSEVRPSWPALLFDDDDEPELTIEIEDEDEDEEPARREHGLLLATTPAPAQLPLLLMASSNPGSVDRLGHALRGVALLEPVRDALSVLEGFGREETALIVVDCRHPTIQAETLLALQPDIPEGSRVVLWGEAPGMEHQLTTLGGGMPDNWVLCGPDASDEDVADVCRVLLE